MNYTKRCLICQEYFQTTNNQRDYCTLHLLPKPDKPIHNVYRNHCSICKTEIITYKSNKFICSPACRKIATREYAREFMKAKRSKAIVNYTRSCIVCKAAFLTINKFEPFCFTCKIERKRIFDSNLIPKDSELKTPIL